MEPTYIYCTCVQHLHVCTQHTLSICGPPCAIVRSLLQNKKWLLGANISHVHSEALLHTTSAISIVTYIIEVALVALKVKVEVKMSATKLPSCVTVKTEGQPSVLYAHDV